MIKLLRLVLLLKKGIDSEHLTPYNSIISYAMKGAPFQNHSSKLPSRFFVVAGTEQLANVENYDVVSSYSFTDWPVPVATQTAIYNGHSMLTE